MNITGAIFDLDGTLLDSMPAWDNIGADYLISKGITPPDDLEDILRPLSFVQAAQYYVDEFNLPYTASKIIDDIYEMVADKYRHNIPLKPYAAELINKLKHKGIKLCVATAMELNLAQAALERNGILDQFDFVTSCGEMDCNKDTPEFFLSVADRLKTTPNETMIFEDALHAITSAKEAGFMIVGVYDESMEANTPLIKQYSDIYISSFKEMEKYL